jgi:membrane-associated phospholipid phosphatase
VALTAVDKLLAGYLGFLTLLIVSRGPFGDSANGWMLLMHALFGVMLYLFTRLRETDRLGQALHVLYPIFLLLPFYSEIGLLNAQLAPETVYANDAVIQSWEDVFFRGQVSYSWIRDHPSVFWSGLLHLAYFSYYPIVIFPPILLVLRGRPTDARAVVFAIMMAFVVCYMFFVLYPVAGPNYTFEHPTGPVREVWSAKLVYGILAGGSAFGTAFPSSHVAASTAATVALWHAWKRVGVGVTLPLLLLTVGTVYCQMHYAIDAIAGLAVGLVAPVVAVRIEK